jgi:two-component system response regulator FixJ
MVAHNHTADRAIQTVCIVDGDTGVRQSLTALLGALPVRVVTFHNAEAFLHCLDADRPCCLITEVHLPGMNGLDLQEELRRRGLRIPVIVISGDADVPIAVRAMHLGALDFIEKPFVERRVLHLVRHALALAA